MHLSEDDLILHYYGAPEATTAGRAADHFIHGLRPRASCI